MFVPFSTENPQELVTIFSRSEYHTNLRRPRSWNCLSFIGWLFLSSLLILSGSCQGNGSSPPTAQHTSPSKQPNTTFQRTSQYLTMRDGVKLAIDVYLPDPLPQGHTIPTLLHQTRYWRAIDYRWLVSFFKDDGPRGLIGTYAKQFLRNGYAWVDVDVRGSGASYGSRPVAYSPEEIRDGAEIVDWIISQPWSNGKVGAMGISYSGGTAEMLLVNQHPAVKAIVPMFSGYDLYSEIAFPGGIYLSSFTKTWTSINRQLDQNQLPFRGWMTSLIVRGVRPVDGPARYEQLHQALQDHETNWSPYDQASGITFRDDPPPSGQTANIDAISPRTYAKEIAESGAAIYSYSGWFDGGYPLAAIKRYQQNPHTLHKLRIGPWDHGGKRRISPTHLGPATFDHPKELLKFFDVHLKDRDTGIGQQPPISYFTMGEEEWKSAHQWPPPSTPTSFYFQEGSGLSRTIPDTPAPPDRYQVNPATGTGNHTRWNTLLGISLPNPYPNRSKRDKELLVYTSDPLENPMEITGHPLLTLHLSCSTSDTTVFAYLEDVTPDGKVHYITEGELRALNRKWQPSTEKAVSSPTVPARTFRREDAEPLNPGEVTSLVIDFLPTSYLFKKGHRIRCRLGRCR